MRGRRILSIVMTLALMFGIMGPMVQPASAASSWQETVGDWVYDYTYFSKKSYALSADYRGNHDITELTCPSAYRGHTVNRFSSMYNFPNLISLTMPAGVGLVDNQAIQNLPALKELKLPEKLEVMNYRAIVSCESLETLYFPPSFIQFNSGIDGPVFVNCPALTDVYFYGDCPGRMASAVAPGSTQVTVHYIEGTRGWDRWIEGGNAIPFAPVGDLALYGMDRYLVKVVDGKTEEPIEGAKVSARGVSADGGRNESQTTGADGIVAFTGIINSVEAKMEGYLDDEISPPSAGTVNILRLYQGDARDLPKHVWAECSGVSSDRVDTLAERYFITSAGKDDTRELVLTVVPAQPDIVAGCWLAEGTSKILDGSEENGTYRIKVPIQHLVGRKSLRVWLEFLNGDILSSPVRLTVNQFVPPKVANLGGSGNSPVSNKTPEGGGTLPFSGLELGLLKWGGFTADGSFDPQTGDVKLVISSEASLEDDDLEGVFDQIKSTLKGDGGRSISGDKAAAELLRALELSKGRHRIKTDVDVLEPSEDFEFKSVIGGILEGNLKEGRYKGIIFVKLELNFSHWFQGATPTPVPIPIYGSVEISGTALSQGGIEWTVGGVSNLSLSLENVFELALRASGGVGVEWLHAGIFGGAKLKAAIKLNYNNRPSRTGLDGLAGLLELGGEVKALIFEYEFVFLQGAWQLLPRLAALPYDKDGGELPEDAYERYPEIWIPDDVPSTAALWDNMLDESMYRPMSRDYLASQSEWLGGEAGIMTLDSGERAATTVFDLQRSIFSDPQPQLVRLGDGALLVYVGDAGAGRSDNDRTALYYSWFDGTSWSEALPVLVDDGRADFAPSLYSDGETAWLVWQHANRSLDGLTDLSGIGAALDLSAAKFSLSGDSVVVEPLGSVTENNDVYESMPQITVVDNVPTVAWVENSAGDIFGMTGTNTVRIAELKGNAWTQSEAAENLGAVLSLSLGVLDGEASAAWITDDDSSLETQDDRTLTLWNSAGTRKLGSGDVQGPVYICLEGENVLTWFDSCRFMCWDGSRSTQIGEGKLGLASAPDAIAVGENGEIALLTSMTWDNSASIGSILYDPDTDTWSKCEALMEPAGNQYNFVPAAVYMDGALVTVFEQDNVKNMTLADDPNANTFTLEKTVNLCWARTEAQARLSIDGLFWDDLVQDPDGNVNLMVYISNSGTGPASGVEITVNYENYVTPVCTIMLDEPIPGGGTVHVPVSFPWNGRSPGEYTVSVDGSQALIGLGLADLAVSARSSYVGGASYVSISVENLGLSSSEGTLVVKSAKDGRVIASENFEEIPYNNTMMFLFTLEDETLFNRQGYAELEVSVYAAQHQSRTDNDTITVLAEGPITEQEPEPDVLHLTIEGGQEEILIPADGEASMESAAFTVSVLNQDDMPAEVPGPVIWSITELEGVSIDENGVVTVTNAAKKAIAGTDGVELTITASCGELEDATVIIVKRDTQRVASLALRRNDLTLDGTDTLAAPKAEGSNAYQYTAVAADQYGSEITGQTVQWTFETADTYVTHSNGTVTVSHGAAQGGTYLLTAALDEKSVSVTVTIQAECEEHRYVEQSVVPPTCTEQGYTVYQCTVCGISHKDNYQAATGHTFGGWTVILEATAAAPGERERTCSVCGGKETEAIPATGGTTGDEPSGDSDDSDDSDDGESSPAAQYSVSTGRASNGTLIVTPTNAVKNEVVTIVARPDAGYTLSRLTVTDNKGNTLHMTKQSDSKYTFVMPDGNVNIEAVFRQNTPEIPFSDVKADAYYHDAVAWAVAQGITSGTSATAFSPDASCTRAQTVTFLWRAAGSPMAENRDNPFVDVQPDAYYYNAVLWAVEQGITAGTSAATFSPDETVTRGQTVAFLYHAFGSSVADSAANPFTDVDMDTYYTKAVQWAVNHNITSGTSATTFSPGNPCTRAQIMTFLYHSQVN